MVVHPGVGTGEDTLVHALLAHCAGSLSGIGGVARPGIVHRLDKQTSGVLLVAKTDAAHRALAAAAIFRPVPCARGEICRTCFGVCRSPRAASSTAQSAGIPCTGIA